MWYPVLHPVGGAMFIVPETIRFIAVRTGGPLRDSIIQMLVRPSELAMKCVDLQNYKHGTPNGVKNER